jgi:hypothetical protein
MDMSIARGFAGVPSKVTRPLSVPSPGLAEDIANTVNKAAIAIITSLARIDLFLPIIYETPLLNAPPADRIPMIPFLMDEIICPRETDPPLDVADFRLKAGLARSNAMLMGARSTVVMSVSICCQHL